MADRALNPYASLLYQGLEQTGEVSVTEFSLRRLFLGKWDIVHVHWPDGFWPRHGLAISLAFALVFLAGLILARLRGGRLVWTTHNVSAHERRNEWARRLYMRGFTMLCDGIISLSPENRDSILSEYPHLSWRTHLVTAHGLYDDHYPGTKLSREACRAKLALASDARVLLALGNIRPYKDYPRLIDAYRELPREIRDRWTLLIAGKSNGSLGQELAEQAQDLPEVRIRDAFVPDDEIAVYMRATDMVVLPYRTMQNSGAANLAVTFGCPVLAPSINSFRDMAQSFPNMVHLFEGELDSDTLQAALLRHASDAVAPDWQGLRRTITRATLEFYHRLTGSEAR